MHITVDSSGRVTPPGAASYVMDKPVTEDVVEGQDMAARSDIRIYACRSQKHSFETRLGETTEYECDCPDDD